MAVVERDVLGAEVVGRLPPGPRTPAVLNTARLMQWPVETLLGWRRRYGDLITVRLLVFGLGVYVADPEAIGEMFSGDQSDLRAGEANEPLAVVLGRRSVLTLDGPEHLRQRRLLLPPFGGAAIGGFREVISQVAVAEVARWRDGERLVLRERMRALTFEVICRVVFGVTEPARIERLRRALLSLMDMQALLLLPDALRRDFPESPWGRFQRRLAVADRMIHEEIGRRRADPDLERRDDVLSLLLAARDEAGEPLSDAELRDELMTLLLAGHETTATALAFAFDLVSREPRVLARLREERGEAREAYLDAVATESLRLRPVIEAAERTLAAPRKIGGHLLPAGIRVYPNMVLVHLREDLYPRPFEFRPERFLEDEAPSYGWLPFGGGIRRCIGAALARLETVEVLRTVIDRVDLEPERPRPEPVVIRGITLVPRHGTVVRVRRRATTNT